MDYRCSRAPRLPDGPDPDLALSKFRNREEAAAVVIQLVKKLVEKIEELRPRVKWSDELENALKTLKESLGEKRMH